MIPLTPKTGRLIRLEAICSDDEAEQSFGMAMSALQERGASDVLNRIVKDCMTVTQEPRMFARRIRIEAVVMSEKEYRDELESAYLQGLYEGKRVKP